MATSWRWEEPDGVWIIQRTKDHRRGDAVRTFMLEAIKETRDDDGK